MKIKLIALVAGALVVGGIVGYYFGYDIGFERAVGNGEQQTPQVKNFEECVAAGNPVMESYPRKCSAEGQTFTEDVGNEMEKSDLIRIDSPRPNDVVTSPLEIIGEARGVWYFEANFSVYLYDGNGQELAQGVAETQDDWMTEEFVPFEATITFEEPETAEGELILEKANPSGLAENTDLLRTPVSFR